MDFERKKELLEKGKELLYKTVDSRQWIDIFGELKNEVVSQENEYNNLIKYLQNKRIVRATKFNFEFVNNGAKINIEVNFE